MSYAELYRQAQTDPQAFWAERAREIDWFRFPETILDQDANGAWRWYRGGVLNTCYLALDRHVAAGRGDDVALIYDSPATGQVQRFTFANLLEQVARTAGALKGLGVEKGDRVIIYMPMVPEAVIAMLACARIGAVHSVVFGGFAPPELATRIDDAEPKVLLTASCGIEFDRVIAYKPLVDAGVRQAKHKVSHVVVLQRAQCDAELRPGEHDWSQWLEAASPTDYVPVEATDPLYILYTSGTTGKPKGVVRDNGGHAVALNWSMQAIYGVDAGDVFWAASDVGWVVGHSYIAYGPLIRGCTSILYEGKPVRTPDAGAFWRVIAEHRVKSFFVAPTAYRAVKKEDPDCLLQAKYDISCLKYQFVAGERLDPPTYDWLVAHLPGVPVIDHWWQTETGWPICTNLAGVELLEPRTGSTNVPIPGYDLRILDEEGRELPPGTEGAVVIKGPLPPGSFPTLWRDHARFEEAYWSRYPGFYLTGDGGYRDADGYVFIMGRIDDVINVAGHRLSTGEMEEVVAAHPAVAECAVFGAEDADKGQVPLALVVLKDGANIEAGALQAELVQMVREQIGAIANFKRALVVKRLPKTRSGKILRQILRKMVDGKSYSMPSTIDDPAILDEIAGVLGVASGLRVG
ncbi:MAG: propionyl-CoA synthetase [Pseudomonadales bacterium]|nr:propionyl-CoA synthetase [Pseudomonadales bacterium]MCP5184530.1 propionyl-CoA synthetase [Pseudomonadales bacterium]